MPFATIPEPSGKITVQEFHSVIELKAVLDQFRSEGKSIGFVPTMGALHDGHLALIRRCRKENDVTVCSIFVNPLQFNNSTDLEHYPRHPLKDREALENESCDILFQPTYEEVYPKAKPEMPEIGYLETILEGAYRPGHFKGVATVVRRFFEIIQPDKAYFGMKDYQQYILIKQLVNDLHLPIEVVGYPTIRTTEGLAMSSRNMRLSEQGRQHALLIHKSLQTAKAMWPKNSPAEIKAAISRSFEEDPACTLEYFELADADTLKPLENDVPHRAVIACIAAYVEDVRLIDNLILIP